MIASLAEGTLKQYFACFKKYWEFCQSQEINPLEYNLNTHLNFLTKVLNDGNSYSVLNSYLNLIFNSIDSKDEKIINRFIKGVSNIRPPNPRYSLTWNPDPVINLLGNWFPLETLELEKLTYKLVTLMALASASRVQTLSLIKVQNIFRLPDKLEIKISEKIKTTAPGRLQPLLVFPFLKNKPELCVASSIEFYIKKTASFRNDEESLILTHKRPYHAASSQTISRWIRKTLSLGGIDTSIFSTHSVRHASTSAALRGGVSIEQIKNTAGWTTSSNTFFKFYNRPLQKPNDTFARTILQSKKGSEIED